MGGIYVLEYCWHIIPMSWWKPCKAVYLLPRRPDPPREEDYITVQIYLNYYDVVDYEYDSDEEDLLSDCSAIAPAA